MSVQGREILSRVDYGRVPDVNPIQAGGGAHCASPPTGFLLAVLKRLAVR